jgi:hypothetical protein
MQGRKHTLLHYLPELLEKDFPHLVEFYKDISNVEDGSKVGIPAVRSAVNIIRDGLKSLQGLVEAMKLDANKPIPPNGTVKNEKTASSNVKFTETMGKFYDESVQSYQKLNDTFAEAEKQFELAVTFYGDEPKTSTPEEFFGVFAKFSKAYQAAKAENVAVRLKAEAEKNREEAKRVFHG